MNEPAKPFTITRRGKLLSPELRVQLGRWFESFPGEMLSAQDVALKFGVSIRHARNELSILKNEGVIVRETVWRLDRSAQ